MVHNSTLVPGEKARVVVDDGGDVTSYSQRYERKGSDWSVPRPQPGKQVIKELCVKSTRESVARWRKGMRGVSEKTTTVCMSLSNDGERQRLFPPST